MDNLTLGLFLYGVGSLGLGLLIGWRFGRSEAQLHPGDSTYREPDAT